MNFLVTGIYFHLNSRNGDRFLYNVPPTIHTSKPRGWQGALKQNTCGMPFGQLLLQVVRIAACVAAAKHIIVKTANEYNRYIMTLHTTYANALGV